MGPLRQMLQRCGAPLRTASETLQLACRGLLMQRAAHDQLSCASMIHLSNGRRMHSDPFHQAISTAPAAACAAAEPVGQYRTAGFAGSLYHSCKWFNDGTARPNTPPHRLFSTAADDPCDADSAADSAAAETAKNVSTTATDAHNAIQDQSAASNSGAAPEAGASTTNPDSAAAEPPAEADAAGLMPEAAVEHAKELDDMLQQMCREAQELILAGQPQQALAQLAEVASQLEADLGMDHFLTYRLVDQLTQLHQEQGQFAEAAEIAGRAVEVLSALPDGGPVAAMFQMRRGAAAFAMGETSAAMRDFAQAADSLKATFAEDFEAIGEARFYMALARLREADHPEDVERLQGRLQEAVKHMLKDKTDRGAALRDAAMRQHDNIIDTAVAMGDWARAVALYEQQSALLRSAGMKPKLTLHLYTFSTLLYIRGDSEAAEAAAKEALAIARQLYSAADDEVQLRSLRLGTIMLERGRFMDAAPFISAAAARFEAALGPDNPVRGEAAFAEALLRCFQLMPFQVAERRQLLQSMAEALAVMADGFGAEHPLVRKSEAILTAMQRTTPGSGGGGGSDG